MALSQAEIDKMLLAAARDGDMAKLEEAARLGADIHTKKERALWYAATRGHTEIVAFLLDGGADLHVNNDEALRWAAALGGPETVALLLDRGADIHAKNDEALIGATLKDETETVALLLDRGADIHAQNDEALRWAVRESHKTTTWLLLRRGADPKAKGEDGEDAFDGPNLAQCLDELKEELQEYFKSGKPSRQQCFSAHAKHAPRVHDRVLDACLTGQFGILIGAPLLASKDRADRQLFQDIWKALPQHWQDDNQGIYVEFIKDGGLNPDAGSHT